MIGFVSTANTHHPEDGATQEPAAKDKQPPHLALWAVLSHLVGEGSSSQQPVTQRKPLIDLATGRSARSLQPG